MFWETVEVHIFHSLCGGPGMTGLQALWCDETQTHTHTDRWNVLAVEAGFVLGGEAGWVTWRVGLLRQSLREVTGHTAAVRTTRAAARQTVWGRSRTLCSWTKQTHAILQFVFSCTHLNTSAYIWEESRCRFKEVVRGDDMRRKLWVEPDSKQSPSSSCIILSSYRIIRALLI